MRRALPLLFMFCLMGPMVPIHAETPLSVEQMREARQRGEVRSLRWVLHQLQPMYPGRLLDVELVHKKGRYLYRIKLIQADGYISRLVVDAYTAEVLRARSRPLEKRKS